MILRVHHLLCSALFVGKGYSEAFTKNMQHVVDVLFPKDEKCDANIMLTTQPDRICEKCPNLVNGACVLDDNNVVSKDEKLAEALGLSCDKTYTREEALGLVARNLTEDIFEKSCHKCRWYEEGLCSYEALQKKYSAIACLKY